MTKEVHMPEPQCDHYTALAAVPHAHAWLQDLEHFERSPNTLDAYGRDLADYLAFCQHQRIDVVSATREHVGLFVQELRNRSNPHGSKTHPTALGTGLAPATLQRRLTVVRLFYDYLVELSVRATNPIPRGRYTSANQFGQPAARGLLRRVYRQPWIPNELQWHAILDALKTASIRDRFMFALSYDAALRREELCALQVDDFDPAHLLSVFAPKPLKTPEGEPCPTPKQPPSCTAPIFNIVDL
jgi:integrase/recombinase XerD